MSVLLILGIFVLLVVIFGQLLRRFAVGKLSVERAFSKKAVFEGEMPGKSAVECGNYINLDVEVGKAVCKYYADVIADWTVEKLAYEN